jgi:hypothetical protein
MEERTRSFALLTFASLLFAPALAQAGGFEYLAAGTRSLGRGGAFIARADDPMALGYNPAALAFLPGYQLMLGSNLAFYDACVDRTGGYDDSRVSENYIYESQFGAPDSTNPDNWVNDEFPRVCRSGYPGPSPQLVFTGHPLPELGFGIGLLVPSGVGNATWGNEDGTIGEDHDRPSPLRYALVSQNLLQVHPTIGFGVSPIPEIAFGVSFQWGITTIDLVSHSTISGGPEDPGDDVRTQFNAIDPFVPVIVASIHAVPIDELDIVLQARISDSIGATGSVRATTGVFGTSMPGSLVPFETRIDNVNLRAGQPWQFGIALRYSDRRERRYRDPERAARVTRRIEDPMQNETFDLELDVVWLHNAQVGDYVAELPGDTLVGVCEPPRTAAQCAMDGASLNAPLSRFIAIPHGWRDQLSIRAGADWNILPGQLAARVGTHFETSGFNSVYHTQDTMPGMRLGLHAGVTLRVDRFDISFAYAHIFQFDETIDEGGYRLSAAMGAQGQCEGEPTYDPSMPVVSRGCYPSGRGGVVNNGTYQADFNIVSLDVRYHFE